MVAAWGPCRVKASTNFFLIFLVLFVSRQKERIGMWGEAPLSEQKKSNWVLGATPP